jgi:hypothetical protein
VVGCLAYFEEARQLGLWELLAYFEVAQSKSLPICQRNCCPELVWEEGFELERLLEGSV